VLAEIAPEGWERSLLVARFHPSVEQLFEERVALNRNLAEWRRLRRKRAGETTVTSEPEPTIDDVHREYEASPVNEEEVTELVGCASGTSFRTITRSLRQMDAWPISVHFGALVRSWTSTSPGPGGLERRRLHAVLYMGTIWISRRADSMPVYAMIFRRLKL
jgi:hypothetical protein